MSRISSRINALIGLIHLVLVPPPERSRDERGLSQSTENAILLAGAVAIAGVIIFVILGFVEDNLPG